jgi:hypothetical protein
VSNADGGNKILSPFFSTHQLVYHSEAISKIPGEVFMFTQSRHARTAELTKLFASAISLFQIDLIR